MAATAAQRDDGRPQFSEATFWEKLKNFAVAAGREVVQRALVLYYCLKDEDTPAPAKAVIASALSYFVWPLDAIPDATPIAGYSDDLGAIVLATGIVAAHVKDAHVADAKTTLHRWFGGGSSAASAGA